MSARTIIDRVIETYDILATEKDLSPRNQRINDTLSRFVGMSVEKDDPALARDVFSDNRVQTMRPQMLSLLSQAECEMERYFAEEFGKAESLNSDDLSRFWYLTNYQELARQDIDALQRVMNLRGDNIHDINPAFIGSGSLPLSAILLHMELGVPVTCLDCDADAVAKSRHFITRLGLADHIKVYELCGTDYDYAQHDVVFVAALVHQRRETLQRLQRSRNNVIAVMRSVEDMRCLLYEPLDVAEVTDLGFTLETFSKASRITVNSTYVFSY